MAAFLTTPLALGHNEAYLPIIKSGAHAAQLVAGPALMAFFVGLQMLKKKLTETHASAFYSDVWKFISKAEARDKVGRIVQYGCRCLQGLLAHAPQSPLQAYKPMIAEVQTTLAWARRTNRWGKELPHIPTLGKAISAGDALQAFQSGVLITFLVQDHIYWLLKVGILKFQNYTAIQWHRRNLRFITFSHVLNFALCVRDISRTQKKLQDPAVANDKTAVKKSEASIYDNKRMMVRYVLTFIQMLHVSQVKVFDDWYIGIMGMVSSYIDASKQWPVAAAPAPSTSGPSEKATVR
mmetsp:Transcript_27630/g.76475  ORF Transcript_27630/g.76475 Transcript_27630/m.76475 type:complete len:294 (+) Transcript_27630:94-975(+)|eukprot:CAMPEP_0117471416 /NCGR_PEP_ID=MMETSP0784-20121206/7719_1 /TAXON_ID=39447 /ORGANISM="" /LENGTH=293 /DNA_ID=CAMNT_0005265533 /DNA_START=83 /DNA_END=964 /DNA_ORIENTATION=+